MHNARIALHQPPPPQQQQQHQGGLLELRLWHDRRYLSQPSPEHNSKQAADALNTQSLISHTRTDVCFTDGCVPAGGEAVQPQQQQQHQQPHLVPCSHCERHVPTTQLQQCCACSDTYCSVCSITNYDEREDRVFCLECSPSSTVRVALCRLLCSTFDQFCSTSNAGTYSSYLANSVFPLKRRATQRTLDRAC